MSARFWSKVDKSGDCWMWTGRIRSDGYGDVWYDGRHQLAHRVAWALAGPGREAAELDHQCRIRACVKPDHLRPVTRKQNNENVSARAGSASGIRGVHRHASGRWRVRVRHNGVEHSGGTYVDVADAERAAVALRLRLFTHNTLDRAAS